MGRGGSVTFLRSMGSSRNRVAPHGKVTTFFPLCCHPLPDPHSIPARRQNSADEGTRIGVVGPPRGARPRSVPRRARQVLRRAHDLGYVSEPDRGEGPARERRDLHARGGSDRDGGRPRHPHRLRPARRLRDGRLAPRHRGQPRHHGLLLRPRGEGRGDRHRRLHAGPPHRSASRLVAHLKQGERSMRNAVKLLGILTLVAAPVAAETWTDVPVIDTNCLGKVKADPDKHKVSCALQCAKGGYGLLLPDGTYLKFDAAGNEKTVAALKETKKADHIRATVEGDRDGESIKVKSVRLD